MGGRKQSHFFHLLLVAVARRGHDYLGVGDGCCLRTLFVDACAGLLPYDGSSVDDASRLVFDSHLIEVECDRQTEFMKNVGDVGRRFDFEFRKRQIHFRFLCLGECLVPVGKGHGIRQDLKRIYFLQA